MKQCIGCGKEIINRRKEAKYCSNKCCSQTHRKIAQPNKHKLNIISIKIPTHTTGSIAEFIVSIDLLRNGFEVFKALSPSCSCDLICQKEKKLFRIEVKTGFYKDNIPTIQMRSRHLKNENFDVLAIVTDLHEIRYIPEFK
jgi:hypothetical protein